MTITTLTLSNQTGSLSKQCRPYVTPQNTASNLGLHVCYSFNNVYTHKQVVKCFLIYYYFIIIIIIVIIMARSSSVQIQG